MTERFKRLTLIWAAAMLASCAHTYPTDTIQTPAQAIAAAGAACDRLGNATQGPWRAKLDGRTWSVWKDDRETHVWIGIDAATGKPTDCVWTPESMRR